MPSSSKMKKKRGKDILDIPLMERLDLLKRITYWRDRIGPFVKDKVLGQCESCQMVNRCHRIPVNWGITEEILRTGKCPDYKSMWKKILGKDEEPYDWGF